MYQIPELNKYKILQHVFSEKSDGNMANAINGKVVNFDQALKNREKFFKKNTLEISKTVCMWVVHGDEVVEASLDQAGVSMRDYKMAVKVDGLITNKKGLNLFLLIADCLPIIIYDPVKEVVALIHAGWKGIDLQIAKKAVQKLNTDYGCNPKNLVVGIGPCAQKKSFIKDNPSQKDDPKWKKYVHIVKNCYPEFTSGSANKHKKILKPSSLADRQVGSGNSYSIDLIGYTKEQLTDAGVAIKNIFDSGIDTVTDERFFSHYREKDLPIDQQGRFACVVGLR